MKTVQPIENERKGNQPMFSFFWTRNENIRKLFLDTMANGIIEGGALNANCFNSICFLFFGPGMKTVQPIENERKSNQPMND
jgi:hypothetical protein